MTTSTAEWSSDSSGHSQDIVTSVSHGDHILIAVCDGHGNYHKTNEAAEKVVKMLPELFRDLMERETKMDLADFHKAVFRDMVDSLRLAVGIDETCYFTGTAFAAALIHLPSRTITTCVVGDCRVHATSSRDLVDLLVLPEHKSIDQDASVHKDNPDALVFTPKGMRKPYVTCAHTDEKASRGLGMGGSIGDAHNAISHVVGQFPPTIETYVAPKDVPYRVCVMSDGVTDVLDIYASQPKYQDIVRETIAKLPQTDKPMDDAIVLIKDLTSDFIKKNPGGWDDVSLIMYEF